MGRTKVLRRLSTTVLAGALVTAAPFVFEGIALASPATQIINVQLTGVTGATYKNDGTNSTVDLAAVVNRSTLNSPQAVSERWSYNASNSCVGPWTVIGTDPLKQTVDPTAQGDNNNKFYSSLEWAPPLGATYCIRAELLDINGTKLVDDPSDDITQGNLVVNNTTDGLNLTLPAKGGFVGYYNPTPTVTGAGTFTTAGTASSTGLALGSNLLEDSTHFGTFTPITYDRTTTNWGAVVPENTLFTGSVPAPTPTQNSFITYAFAGVGPGVIELRPAVAYYVTKVNSFTPTPSAAFQLPDVALNHQQRYVITALDQKGNPIGGLKTLLHFTDPNDNGSYCALQVAADGVTKTHLVGNEAGCPGAAAVSNSDPAVPVTTNVFGKIVLDVSNSDAEVLPFTLQSVFNQTTGFSAASDFTDHLSLSTVPQTAASGTTVVSGHPTFSIYASQNYGDGTLGPILTTDVKDQNGNQIVQGGGAANPTPIEYSYTRTVTSGTTKLGSPGDIGTCNDTNTYPLTSPVLNATNANANGDAVITPDSPAAVSGVAACNDTESGTDTFTVWVEVNGTPGYQAGSDILVGTVTVKFGPERIYFQPCDPSAINLRDGGYNGLPESNCNAQVKAGLDKPLTLVDTIYDGASFVPVTSRGIDLDLSFFPGVVGTDSGFSATNPGITKLTPNHATCVTGASDGTCSFSVFSNLTGFIPTVRASDPSLSNAVTSDNGTDQVRFRNYSAVVNTLSITSVTRIEPDGNIGGVPAAPGEPALYKVHLADQNAPAPDNLRNEVVTLNVSQGFFTPLPSDGSNSYTKLSFATDVPADQAALKGDIKSLGQTETTVSDDSGNIYFTIGTLKDPGYDNNGDILGNLTVTFNSATKSIVNNGTLYSTNYFRDGGLPVAQGTYQVLEGTFLNTGQLSVGSSKPSGDKAVATVNSIPSDKVNTVIKETDSFGNLISTKSTAVLSGPGAIALSTPAGCGGFQAGSYNNDYITSTTPACKVLTYVNPTSQNPATGSGMVTFTSVLAKNTWLVNTVTHALSINSIAQNATDSYTVNWYTRGATGLLVTVNLSPSATVAAGTPINVSAHIVDAHGRAVKGLGIQFFAAGPNTENRQTPNPFTCVGNQCNDAVFTDANGNGGWTFNSTFTGGVTITTVVTDLNGNEVYRHVDHATYTGIGKPRIAQVSKNGVVTLSLTTDPQEAGKTAIFFRHSGLTGVVVPLGTATISNTGVATRTFNSPKGGILSLYGKVEDASLTEPYTNSISFKVQ